MDIFVRDFKHCIFFLTSVPPEGVLSIYKLWQSGFATTPTYVDPRLTFPLADNQGKSSLLKQHMALIRVYENSLTHEVAYFPLQAKHHCYR